MWWLIKRVHRVRFRVRLRVRFRFIFRVRVRVRVRVWVGVRVGVRVRVWVRVRVRVGVRVRVTAGKTKAKTCGRSQSTPSVSCGRESHWPLRTGAGSSVCLRPYRPLPWVWHQPAGCSSGV